MTVSSNVVILTKQELRDRETAAFQRGYQRGIADAHDPDPSCHADRDGECDWPLCPQLRDNEPKMTGRHCPLDKGDPYE